MRRPPPEAATLAVRSPVENSPLFDDLSGLLRRFVAVEDSSSVGIATEETRRHRAKMRSMTKRLGALTIGQSPRTDIIPDLRRVLGEEIEIIEAGALDGLTPLEVRNLAPDDTEQVLLTRLRDGSGVRIAHRHIVPLLRRRLDELAPQVEAILLLCTGTFEPFPCPRPILYPERFILAMAQAVAPRHIGVITPDPAQVGEQQTRWGRVAVEVTVRVASPYAAAQTIPALSIDLVRRGADLIVLDSLGYSVAMKEAVRRAAGCPVLLPRTVLARAAAELLD